MTLLEVFERLQSAQAQGDLGAFFACVEAGDLRKIAGHGVAGLFGGVRELYVAHGGGPDAARGQRAVRVMQASAQVI